MKYFIHKTITRSMLVFFIVCIGFFAHCKSIYAFDLFDIIDPDQKNEKLQRAKRILDGASNIVSSGEEMDYESELSLGESVALEGFKRFGMPISNNNVQKYVNMIGNAIARNSSRPDIPFYFVVVSSDRYNAFSCPGGIIFITDTLIKSMEDESELAGVIAHEIAHVCHKHAISALKRAKFFEGVGKIATANSSAEKQKRYSKQISFLQDMLFDKGLDQSMEFEADNTALDLLYRTGYQPQGLIRVLEKLKTIQKRAKIQQSWFSTHPPLKERLFKCEQNISNYRDINNLAQVKTRFITYRSYIK